MNFIDGIIILIGVIFIYKFIFGAMVIAWGLVLLFKKKTHSIIAFAVGLFFFGWFVADFKWNSICFMLEAEEPRYNEDAFNALREYDSSYLGDKCRYLHSEKVKFAVYYAIFSSAGGEKEKIAVVDDGIVIQWPAFFGETTLSAAALRCYDDYRNPIGLRELYLKCKDQVE
jgi:hypothetical protein